MRKKEYERPDVKEIVIANEMLLETSSTSADMTGGQGNTDGEYDLDD